MKTFYVLWDGVCYLSDCKPFLLGNEEAYVWHKKIGEAMPFESLCQAFEFLESSGLQLEVLRVEITSAWTPDLFTENLPT
jgi:hypothetical protein